MSSRTYRRQKQARRGDRRRAARKQQNTTGLWLLLALVLLAMVVWALLRVPIDLLHQIEVGALVLLLVVILLIVAWFVLRSRLTPKERAWRNKQQEELDQADETARTVGAREVELDDLRHLTDREFERLAAALVETMGVASEVEVVGGAGDGGIDVRGKNRFHQLFVAQCKRYFNHSVAPKETREFAGAMSSHESRDGWFITTSTFSPQAEYDVKKWTSAGLMVLVDGALLLSFIREHWNALPDDWQWRLTQCMAESDRQRRAE